MPSASFSIRLLSTCVGGRDASTPHLDSDVRALVVCLCACVCMSVCLFDSPPISCLMFSPALRLLGRPIGLLAVQGGAGGVRLRVVPWKSRPQLCLQPILRQFACRHVPASADHTGECSDRPVRWPDPRRRSNSASACSQVRPVSGPLEGGVRVTITGSNLGMRYQDVVGGVTVADVQCLVQAEGYQISTR